MGFVDGTEQFAPGLVKALGSVIIGDGVGDFIQLFEGDAGLEVLRGVGKRFEPVIGRHHVIVAVVLADTPPGAAIF